MTTRQKWSLCYLAALVTACSPIDETRQLRTFADMRTIVARIEILREAASSPPSREAVQSEIESVHGGADAWGTQFHFFSRSGAAGYEYVLVSAGSDRKLEASDPDHYFALPEVKLRGETERDLVFKSGVPVTLAGK